MCNAPLLILPFRLWPVNWRAVLIITTYTIHHGLPYFCRHKALYLCTRVPSLFTQTEQPSSLPGTDKYTNTSACIWQKERREVMTKIYCGRDRRRHPEYARWGCTSELFSICYVQVNGNLPWERKNNCKHLCLIHVYETKQLLESSRIAQPEGKAPDKHYP